MSEKRGPARETLVPFALVMLFLALLYTTAAYPKAVPVLLAAGFLDVLWLLRGERIRRG